MNGTSIICEENIDLNEITDKFTGCHYLSKFTLTVKLYMEFLFYY